MSDPTAPESRPTAADDELVSRVLDGEPEPGDAEAVAGDPVLRDRLAEFTAVAAALGTPVTPAPDVARDAAIGAALDAAARRDDRDAAPVVELAPRRRARERRWLAGAAAAAVVVALAAALPALLRSGSSGEHGQTAAATTEAAASPVPPGADTGEAAPTSTLPGQGYSTGGALDSAAASALGDIGTFATTADLAAAVRLRAIASPAASSTTARSSVDLGSSADAYQQAQTCVDRQVADNGGLGAVVGTGTATVAGRTVVVVVFRSTGGVERGVVADAATCVADGPAFVL
jgi:hypothetical protein